MIYLDSAATTKIDRNVLESMLPYLVDQYGKPGSLYKLGRNAKSAIDKARSQVATMLNCVPENIVFTSGGSESNSMVFQGVKDWLKSIGKTHIIVSMVEHKSVINAAKSLEKDGFKVTFIPVNKDGFWECSDVERAFSDNTGLVSVMSVMYVNNETGAVNDVRKIGKFCSDKEMEVRVDASKYKWCDLCPYYEDDFDHFLHDLNLENYEFIQGDNIDNFYDETYYAETDDVDIIITKNNDSHGYCRYYTVTYKLKE